MRRCQKHNNICKHFLNILLSNANQILYLKWFFKIKFFDPNFITAFVHVTFKVFIIIVFQVSVSVFIILRVWTWLSLLQAVYILLVLYVSCKCCADMYSFYSYFPSLAARDCIPPKTWACLAWLSHKAWHI